jgi:hypothetical protein
MSKKNKRGILNQIVDEPEETKEEVIEQEPMIINPEVFKVEQPEVVVEEIPIEEPEKTELDRIAEALAEAKAEEVPVEEVEPKEFHHEFQKDYFFGTPSETVDKETIIDALPIEEPIVRSIDTLTKSELREFQRTGKMPQ